MRDYDEPEKPADTPPVIDPATKPKTSEEMEADGEAEEALLERQTAPSEIETELGVELTERNRRDGLGEADLDSLPPD
ncbi:hypothetical protein [Qipengyuania sp. JC766]|uniref:hypothetical protein n=1 Tax=Qipengyuania sp. JC766 TaxID=3232139 RepID=UPI00345AA94B